jgi:hypothetical protein
MKITVHRAVRRATYRFAIDGDKNGMKCPSPD